MTWGKTIIATGPVYDGLRRVPKKLRRAIVAQLRGVGAAAAKAAREAGRLSGIGEGLAALDEFTLRMAGVAAKQEVRLPQHHLKRRPHLRHAAA